MARVYKLGTVLGWFLLAAAIVYVIVLIFGETIYNWIKSVVNSKGFAYVIARGLVLLLITSIVAIIKELNNWRVTFEPRFRIWREVNRD